MRRSIERVPADDDCTRLLAVIEPHEEVPEADDGAGTFVAFAPDRLRQRVIGPMGKRVAIDHQERAVHTRRSAVSSTVSSERIAGPSRELVQRFSPNIPVFATLHWQAAI